MIRLAEAQVQSTTLDHSLNKQAVQNQFLQRIGAITQVLLGAGYVNDQQLSYAQRVQSKLLTSKTIINILLELKIITDGQLREILAKNPVAARLGDILIELGYLEEVRLNTAIEIQEQSKPRKKLGQILLEHRFIDDDKLAEALAYQCGVSYVDLHTSMLDLSLIKRRHLNLYTEHLFLPLYMENGIIVVAFCDPSDAKSRERAEKLFGTTYASVIVTEKAFSQVLSFVERSSLRKHSMQVNDNTAVAIVDKLLAEAVSERASDIHIEPTHDRIRVRFRCDGIMMPHQDLPKEMAQPIVSRIKIMAKADITEKRRHQDGRILYEETNSGMTIDLRTSFYVTIYGEKIVLRLLNKPNELLSLNDSGLTPYAYERFCHEALDIPSGVVIITGPTGSGKTTTLYGCINYLNDDRISIITAEDPVEYVIDGIAQCSINPKINVTYEETLRHIVRQDPDVIVLGEIRDRFSAETAIQAALTGHKVLTTFHTEDSIGGLLRLLNMDIEAFLISSTVVCVVAQRLLRKICPHCAIPYFPTSLELSRLGFEKDDLMGFTFQVGQGCKACRYTGCKGRVGVFELLVLNEMVKDAVLNRRTSYEIRRISLETSGLVTLFEDGLVKAARGEVALAEVMRCLPRSHKPRPLEELKQLLGEKC